MNQLIEYYRDYDFDSNYINRNQLYNLGLYCPAFNTFLLMYDDIDVLRKVKNILSSKIRLEIINFSKCISEHNVANNNCFLYSKLKYEFAIKKNSTYDCDLINNIKFIRDYILLSFFIVCEFYFLKASLSPEFDADNIVSENHFLNNVHNNQHTLLFNEQIKESEQSVWFYRLMERTLYSSSSIQEFFKTMKQQIGANLDYLIENFYIELIVFDHYLRKNIKDD
jgi:hypothetical protein